MIGDFGVRQTGIQTLALPLTSKFFKLEVTKPQFFHL